MSLFVTLSVMMFVLFFVWGAWYVTMNSFMVARGMDAFIGNAYSVAPIAAIITPFFMGFFADRFVNAEKLQGVLLFLSGALICLAPQFASPEQGNLFVGILLAHTLCFMPTLGLSNTICLKHLVDSGRFEIIDCQLPTGHLKSLGAIEISRDEYENALNRWV